MLDLTPYLFVVYMMIPSFGGDVTATFRTVDLESCLKFRRVIEREMLGMSLKFTVGPCIGASAT